MKTLKHFVFAITLLVGTTLFANNDPVVNDKTSTTCEEFDKHQKKIECLEGALEQINGTYEEWLDTLGEFEDLKFEDVFPDDEEIGDFGFVDIEEMELLREEMEALGFEFTKNIQCKVLEKRIALN
jgi:hypothetical protein